MTRNRFEQVDELQPDAIALTLRRREGSATGQVHCPAACSGGRLQADSTSPEMPAKDAFRSTIKLANELKAPVVVIDPDGMWQVEWGALYRAE
jgi:hypothetical protein